MMNQNRIAIHTAKLISNKTGLVDVKKFNIKVPGIKGSHTKKPINPALELKKNNIYNNHTTFINTPPIIPNLT